MIRLEDAIRDHLSEHLDLLEHGLDFVKKEFRLPNPDGAGGRIDIVARDRFGHVVVIEIKRSDQAARQALNEIHKYTALFRIKQGLDEKTVRLVVVSTDWHELLLPLSEYAAITPYSVEGFKIVADSDGVVATASPVNLDAARNKVGPMEISRCHAIYLFESPAVRNEFAGELAPLIYKVGIEDFVLLKCDYRGTNESVVFPHCLYLCFCSPLSNTDPQALEQIKGRIDWTDGLDQPDENFICAIQQPQNRNADSFEIGFPEKLTNIVREWTVTVSVRNGRLDSHRSLLSDAEIIALAQAVGGGSDFYFGKTASPRFAAGWNAFRENIVPVVTGYPKWNDALPKLLDEIETNAPKAVVSAFVYGPANLLVSLYAIALVDDYSRCPHLEIVIEDPESRTVRAILGFLVWNGVSIAQPFSSVVKSVFGDVSEWSIATHFAATVDFEPAAIAAHNLEAVVVEWRFSGDSESGPYELSTSRGKLERNAPEHWLYRPINEFPKSHQEYLAQLQHGIEEHVVGLRESILSGAKGELDHD